MIDFDFSKAKKINQQLEVIIKASWVNLSNDFSIHVNVLKFIVIK